MKTTMVTLLVALLTQCFLLTIASAKTETIPNEFKEVIEKHDLQHFVDSLAFGVDFDDHLHIMRSNGGEKLAKEYLANYGGVEKAETNFLISVIHSGREYYTVFLEGRDDHDLYLKLFMKSLKMNCDAIYRQMQLTNAHNTLSDSVGTTKLEEEQFNFAVELSEGNSDLLLSIPSSRSKSDGKRRLKTTKDFLRE